MWKHLKDSDTKEVLLLLVEITSASLHTEAMLRRPSTLNRVYRQPTPSSACPCMDLMVPMLMPEVTAPLLLLRHLVVSEPPIYMSTQQAAHLGAGVQAAHSAAVHVPAEEGYAQGVLLGQLLHARDEHIALLLVGARLPAIGDVI